MSYCLATHPTRRPAPHQPAGLSPECSWLHSPLPTSTQLRFQLQLQTDSGETGESRPEHLQARCHPRWPDISSQPGGGSTFPPQIDCPWVGGGHEQQPLGVLGCPIPVEGGQVCPRMGRQADWPLRFYLVVAKGEGKGGMRFHLPKCPQLEPAGPQGACRGAVTAGPTWGLPEFGQVFLGSLHVDMERVSRHPVPCFSTTDSASLKPQVREASIPAVFSFFSFWPHRTAYGILVPGQGVEPAPVAMEAWGS